MIVACLAFAFLQPDLLEHKFVYVAQESLNSVSLAGSFNNWDRGAHPMKKSSDGKTWSLSLRLKPDRYHYKFVLNGENWVTDPAAKSEDDGNGNQNSILLLLPPDYATPASASDGTVTLSALSHRQLVPDMNYDKGQLSLRLTVRPGDVRSVRLVANGKAVPAKSIEANEFKETYSVSVPWDRKSPLRYAFRLVDGDKTLDFGANGLKPTRESKSFVLDPKSFKPFLVPQWVEGSVFYQIFPDRFANGSTANDPKTITPWDGEPTYYNRYGGDVAGISERVPYLKGLGVNAVYFNPVMKAPSNHRYDPVDFYTVDPEFGTNKEFADLTRKLKSNGIVTVLDQIFDHVGTTFAPFADLLKNQEKSAYKNWFFVRQFPVEVKQNPNYVAWFNAESMPKVNLENKDCYDYLMKSVDFWMKEAAIKGWRLDVANEIPMFFMRDLRQRVKKIDPSAWIVGEVWGNAQPWLGGDQWDASMNYPFRDAVLRFVAQGTASATQFQNLLMQTYNWYAPQVARNQLNLLSSHDTERFITMCRGDRRLAKLGAIIQFTWPGSPSVYYGEELGMPGGRDPDNRRGMNWNLVRADNDILTLYKRLIALRTKSQLLAEGDPVPLMTHDQDRTLAFARKSDMAAAIVVVNRSESPRTVRTPVAAKLGRGTRQFKDALKGNSFSLDERGDLTIALEPLSAAILMPADSLPISASRPTSGRTNTNKTTRKATQETLR